MNILVVDDSSTARMVIMRCLEIGVSRDASFVEAGNGAEALEKMANNDFDLIVTDLNMPVMNGQELLLKLKDSPDFKGIPVVVITSVANPGLEPVLKSHGASRMISKPMSPMVLSEAVKSLNIETVAK